jgi:hypothetical protein
MANLVTVRKLWDNDRRAALHVYLASDGSSGELSGEVIVDASTLSGSPATLTVERVEGSFNGFEGTLLFDATSDVPFLTLPNAANGGQFYFPFQKHYGGIANTKATGYTGDILLTTNGFTAATDKGHIFMIVRKD